MKVRTRTAIFAAIITFSSSAFAEYYVVNPNGPHCINHFPCGRSYVRHVKPVRPVVVTQPVVRQAVYVKPVRHFYTHRVYHHTSWWERKHKCCYDPDMATGDDDPCINPNMDIDE